MIHGTAKIVTNEGNGKYTITQTFIDSSDDTYKAGTVGLVAVDAWDVSSEAARAVDDQVIFQMQDSFDGKVVPIIIGPSLGGGGGSGPMSLAKWYFITADKAWTTIDTRDWGGRWIWIALIHDPGELYDGSIWENFAEHYDTNLAVAGYAAQEEHTWFRIILNSNGDVQNISRAKLATGGPVEGDFFLRMKADGNLEIMIENFVSSFSVQFSIQSTPAKPEEETIE